MEQPDTERASVAVVTGASRGVGKGIAIALGQAGMTVYVTGRSGDTDASEWGGTVADTAGEVSRAGGRGISVVLDHADDDAVAGLFRRIEREHGRLDILVNNAAKLVGATLPVPFWEKPLEAADLLSVGLRSHLVASYYAAPLLIANGQGLIVNTGHYGAVSYFQGPAYGAQKAGSDKMVADMAKELRPHNVAAVSIWMGSVATERTLAWREQHPTEERSRTFLESTQFTGRLIAGLYASKLRMKYSGQAVIGAELAWALDVTDIAGQSPPSRRKDMGAPHGLHPSLLE
jgi:NAD(P)-dependent dehydrogenase (short-subunit alcohol dehydrogenase family)